MSADTQPGEWIDWHGGTCPLPEHYFPQVRYRSGGNTEMQANRLRWTHTGAWDDILAYRTTHVIARDGIEAQRGLNDVFPGDVVARPPANEPMSVKEALEILRIIAIRKLERRAIKRLEMRIEELERLATDEDAVEAAAKAAMKAIYPHISWDDPLFQGPSQELWRKVARAALAYKAQPPSPGAQTDEDDGPLPMTLKEQLSYLKVEAQAPRPELALSEAAIEFARVTILSFVERAVSQEAFSLGHKEVDDLRDTALAAHAYKAALATERARTIRECVEQLRRIGLESAADELEDTLPNNGDRT